MVVPAILVGIIASQLTLFISSVFLHRALAHRSLILARPIYVLCRVSTWLLTGIRPYQWVAVHRFHHDHSDDDEDPHSPGTHGFLRVQFLGLLLYRRAARRQDILDQYSADIPRDRWDRILFDWGWIGLSTTFVIASFMVGVRFAALAALTDLAAYVLIQGLLNTICHGTLSGPAPSATPDPTIGQATNSRLIALVSVGEGLHANHHKDPSSPRFSRTDREFDLGWALVSVLVWLRLATITATGRRSLTNSRVGMF